MVPESLKKMVMRGLQMLLEKVVKEDETLQRKQLIHSTEAAHM
jgi:hypothetical protein